MEKKKSVFLAGKTLGRRFRPQAWKMVFPEFIREYYFHNCLKKLFLLKPGPEVRQLRSRAELLGRALSGTFGPARCNVTEKAPGNIKKILIDFFPNWYPVGAGRGQAGQSRARTAPQPLQAPSRCAAAARAGPFSPRRSEAAGGAPSPAVLRFL